MTQTLTMPTVPRPALGLRARTLLALERWFPPATQAPAATGEHAAWEFRKAAASYGPAVEALGGIEGKTVLDFGCGWGGETVWLAERCAIAVGCDVNDDALRDAEAYRAHAGVRNAAFARCGDTTLPFDDQRFDAVFSTNVFEHVMHVEAMLGEIHRVLKPGGAFVSTFGPLFHSPLGYHLSWACQVPWAHVFFGLGPVIEVRNLRRGPIAPRSWRDTGLNGLTFPQFRRAVRRTGFHAVALQRVPVRGLTPLAALPLLGRYFTFGIRCHLVRD